MTTSGNEPLGYAIDPENGERVANLLNEDVLVEFQNHAYWEVREHEEPSDLDKIRQIPNCKVRESCSNCGYEETFRSVDRLEEMYATHAELQENDCSEEDVVCEAVCPRHGRIPLEYGYCDECRDNQRIMNDL